MHTAHRLRWLLPLLAAAGTTAAALLTTIGQDHPSDHAPHHAVAVDFTDDPRPTFHAPAPAPSTTRPSPAAPAHSTKPPATSTAIAATRTAIAEHTARPAAGRSTTRTVLTTGASARAYAQRVLSAAQFRCLSAIITRESGWSVTAENPTSGAYGLMQALPGSKMASYGSDWRYNGRTQIRWGIHYVNAQYGSACDAWAFWQSHGWY